MLQIRDEEDLNSLKPDSWGIPSLDARSIDSRPNALGGVGAQPDTSPKLDLIFMPAVAFDRFHHRLGHGMGFYDRYLESYRTAVDQAGGRMPRLGTSGLFRLVTLLTCNCSWPGASPTTSSKVGQDPRRRDRLRGRHSGHSCSNNMILILDFESRTVLFSGLEIWSTL